MIIRRELFYTINSGRMCGTVRYIS